MTDTRVFFRIEGGLALKMIKKHIKERTRVRNEVAELAKDLNIKEAVTHRLTGVLLGICLNGRNHPDFIKPNKKGISYPKKNSPTFKIFEAQIGYTPVGALIAHQLKVPFRINYTHKNGSGTTGIGHPFERDAGFLFMGPRGPYAMYVPDVPTAVKIAKKEGKNVEEPAKSFKFGFEGCTRIPKEEWQMLVLQEEINNKKAK